MEKQYKEGQQIKYLSKSSMSKAKTGVIRKEGKAHVWLDADNGAKGVRVHKSRLF